MSTNLRLQKHAFAPLCEEDGTPKSKIQPYLPVVDACSVCPARCCRLRVKVSLPDAVHYCRTLHVPFFSGLSIVPTQPHEHSFRLKLDRRFEVREEEWTGHAEIELSRREDGGCTSLVNVGGYERCGVYHARPSGCRTYPVSWESDETRGGPGAIVCPVAYGIRPDEERQFLADVEAAIARWAIHDEIITAWNEAELDDGHTIAQFLPFAIARAAQMMEVDAAIVLDPGTPESRLYDEMVRTKIVKPRT